MAPGEELDRAVDAEIERRRSRAEEIRQEALAPGADFAALAKKYSEDFGTRNEGGSLGTFAKGAHPLAFDEVAFSLQPGEIGPVVKTDFGFHVMQSLDRKPAGPRTLEEMSSEIRRRLLRERQSRELRAWLQLPAERFNSSLGSSSAPGCHFKKASVALPVLESAMGLAMPSTELI